jgi:two-component system, LytTR family, response regulator
MKEVKAIIIDDELGNIITLKGLLERFVPEVEIVGTARNKDEGIELINEVVPQLVFLDIEMPYGSGFDLLEALGAILFETIFITAYDSYAIKAFKFSAVDYLVKPVNIDDLKFAVEKAIKNIQMRQANDKIGMLLSNLKNTGGQQRLAIQWADGFKFVKLDEIIRLEASGSYAIIHMADNKKITATKMLGDFEGLLPDSIFVRVHHSDIININYVKQYHKGRGGFVEMEDGAKIEVAIRRKMEFLKRISW